MRIKLKTAVKGHYKSVMGQFDRDLFEALAPKMAKLEIVEFTGSQKGDRVFVRFLSPIKAEWESIITEDSINEEEAFFTDEGVLLPYPLKYWKHHHIVRRAGENESLIIDDIQFSGPNFLVTLLLYPFIFLGFYPRKKIYKSYFGTKNQ